MVIKNKITESQYEILYAELYALLSAGLDFSHAFVLLIEEEKNSHLKNILKRLYEGIIDGNAMWQSMEQIGAFRSLDFGVIRIGEQTGRLIETLVFLRDYYHKRTALKRMISSAISYPLVILSVAIIVVIFMLIVIVPMFEQVYSRMGGELPLITQWIISLSQSFPFYILLMVIVLTAAYFTVRINKNKIKVQKCTSTVLLCLPFIGSIISKNYQVQFCKLLFLLSSSGIPLLTSIAMMADVIRFYPYSSSLNIIYHELEQGKLFSMCLASFPQLYDQKLIALIRVGEETNRLKEMLSRQADTLTNDLEYQINRMGNMLEPLLILIVGLLVAVILISMYMPMFRLGNIMG